MRGRCALVILIEQGDGFHAGEELAEEVALVGGVDGVALQAEAHQERIDAQDALEVRQDGDGAAAAGRDGLDAVDLGHRLGRGL